MEHTTEPTLVSDPFLAGMQLFNAGEYWHAHEQWEICWRAAQGEEAEFYKALIQTAAALVKWRQGNLRGLRLNWAKAQRRLAQLPAVYRGVDVVALAMAMAAILADPASGEGPNLGA
ncbi:DUF309 domain-containing protein [uncultured Chloroflexus sp.]|uniref:DUF309 domain-containing protein n=1 Tax=uncultured Chloroflexus sp. TaxID=214040 RepID=UPI0026057F0A|nr:DUF309 domain-containing protein [uncultured Chloroflexus sp.]